MGLFKIILTILLAIVAVGGVIFLVLTAYGWEKVWERTSGPADRGAVVFEDLAKGPKPNQALICPDGLCQDGERDEASPIYALPVDELRRAFFTAVENEDDLERVEGGSDDLQVRYVQRTRLLRFPDTINVRFLALGDNRSTIALYGQSLVGTSDLGVNLKRLRRWLSRLEQYEEKS